MRKALNPDGLARRPADLLARRFGCDMRNAFERELTREDDRVGKLRVKAKRLKIRDAELRREVHVQADRARIKERRRIRQDDGRHAGVARFVEKRPHRRQIVVVENRVDGEVRLDAGIPAAGRKAGKVRPLEVPSGMRAHVEFAYAEIDGIRAGGNRG